MAPETRDAFKIKYQSCNVTRATEYNLIYAVNSLYILC